ncbi:bifunctional diguanylate cyclase/phosphodiesterase [Jeotgalibacillus proteolyticus]|uniref:Histidine kinase n=1 Tax=Jeotgalibacillus proteolyticus TaxID=2082395 RepID=A0A2S5GFP7_9BACL|nr:EAL domain-containing protein [Jeotgalibacillus proteolyticus]PPA71862.1 histidine kinase [Jeotgalibacillus proteolyticus]
MYPDRYSRLAEITKMIHTELDRRSVLLQVVKAISEEIVRCDSVGIYLPIEQNRFQGYVGKPDHFNGITLDKMIIDLEHDKLAQEIVDTKKAIYIPDTSKDSRPDPRPIELFKIKSLFGMPIHFEESLYGLVFLFDYESPLHLTDEEVEALESYVLMAAVAIRNGELLENSRKLVEDKQLLLDATKSLASCKTIKEVLDTSFIFMGKALNNKNVAAHLRNFKSKIPLPQKLSQESQWKEEDWKRTHEEVNLDFTSDPVFNEVIRTKKAVLIPDVSRDPRPHQEAVERFGFKSMYVIPMVSRGEVLGTLGVVEFSGPKSYSESQQRLAESIADATASVLDNLLHLDQLEEIIEARTSELQEKNEILEQMNDDLRLLGRKNESILNSAGEGIYGLNGYGVITFCNPIAASLLGWEVEEMVGKHQDEIISHFNKEEMLYKEESSPIHLSLLTNEKIHSFQEKFARKDGEIIDVEYVSMPIQDNGIHNGVVVTFRDVTERKQMERKIHHQAYYDALTHLPNRSYLVQKMKKAIKESDEHGSKVGVLFLDLDRFKLINDSLGHKIGDIVLHEVAERFRTLISERVTVARLGGDEFIILVEEVKHADELGEIAALFIKRLNEPFRIQGNELFTNASVGISVFPDDAKDEDDLIRNADTAMYVAKEQGGTYHYFTRMLMEQNIERSNLLNALYVAIERDELDVEYQPKVDYRQNKIVGVEALLRWNHPEWGNIAPDRFIPIAEETGMILKLGDWILKQAATQQKLWQDNGFTITMAVNFSMRQIQHPRLVETVQSILEETGMDPSNLEIELTEHTLIQSKHVAKLYDLKNLGLSLSLDDFGTGYCSLRYIKDFPIDTIKIDRSFVENMTHEPHIMALNSTIIYLAKQLNYDVIAEGVETKEQIDHLMDGGCHLMQGYFFSKPVSSNELFVLLKNGLTK